MVFVHGIYLFVSLFKWCSRPQVWSSSKWCSSPVWLLGGPTFCRVCPYLPLCSCFPAKQLLYLSIFVDCRYTKPWKDLDTGVSYCLFFPYTPEHLALAIPKSKDMRQDISVSINVSLRGAKNISGSASALFVGGFSILEADKVIKKNFPSVYLFTKLFSIHISSFQHLF